jgi:hypothetical protein
VHAILFVATPPDTFGVFVIVETLTVALVGGVGSKWGPVLGAALMIPLGEFLDARWGDTYPGIQRIVFGLALVLVILYAREGLFWKLRDLLRKGAAAPTTVPLSPPPASAALSRPVQRHGTGPNPMNHRTARWCMCSAPILQEPCMSCSFENKRNSPAKLAGQFAVRSTRQLLPRRLAALG